MFSEKVLRNDTEGEVKVIMRAPPAGKDQLKGQGHLTDSLLTCSERSSSLLTTH